MAAQQGKDLLLKIDVSGAFHTVAGLRATRVSFNAETVDVTNAASSSRWRELLAGAGVRAATLSGSGVFLDDVSDDHLRTHFFNGTIPVFQAIIPDFGTVQGPFQITALEYSGAFDGEAVYEISLASAGALTFTLAA